MSSGVLEPISLEYDNSQMHGIGTRALEIDTATNNVYADGASTQASTHVETSIQVQTRYHQGCTVNNDTSHAANAMNYEHNDNIQQLRAISHAMSSALSL
jgi:hypothetical protein